MTSVKCQHCDRIIGSPQGLVAHVKSMHPEIAAEARQRVGLVAVPNVPPSNGNGIRWEDPPAGARGRASLIECVRPILSQLKANPGRWARVREYSSASTAATQAKALRESFPDLEIIGRRVDTGSAIFARYLEAE